MDKMDAVNAPQWADFDASVRSDIDEYFNVEHEELDPEQLGDLQYHSCPSTPNAKKPIGGSPYKTPKSDSTRSSQELSGYMENLQINEKNMSRGKMSITPRTYALKKSIASLKKLSTPRGIETLLVKSESVQSVEQQLDNSTEKSSDNCANVIKSPEAVDNAEAIDNAEEENAEHNCTLVATEESVKNSPSQCDPKDHGDQICAPPPSETIAKAEDCIAQPAEPKVEKAGNVKSVKLQNRVDSSGQAVLNNRKNLRGKPTVLTSHARRQSTSKFRRVSNKYVPLAEALSKFQNCTPERFRSSTKKDGKGSNAPGPLQKVKQTTLKVTCATSPLLRCKYRSRAVTVLNQEEREKLEIEEIRKNRIKPNPLKQPIVKYQKNLKTTIPTISEPTSKLKKTTGNESMKKIDKKPTTITEALPSTHVTTKNNGPVLPKKTDEPTTSSRSLSSRCKTAMNPPKVGAKIEKASSIADPSTSSRRTMMNPPKSGDQLKKTSSSVDSLSSSRRTMMNPPKTAFGKTNVPTKNPSALSSSRKTMMNPPETLIKANNKSTAMPNPLSSKTTMKPPEVGKKVENELKPHTAHSISMLDQTSIRNILSSTILSESMRKNTPCKKVLHTVVSTDEGASIKAEEISHCGIPVGNAYKKITEAIPFSFASNNKQQSQNKKNIIKNQADAKDIKTKTFHARPVPSYVIKPPSNVAKPPSKHLVTADAPFSFQVRDENILKKKKEMFERMVEREKQNRIFHARPAPKFKPVFVRGASSENLRTNTATEKQTKLSAETRRRGLSQNAIADNRENTEPNVVTTNQPFPKLKNPLTNLNRKFKKIAA